MTNVTSKWLEDRAILSPHGFWSLPVAQGSLHIIACNEFYDAIEFWQLCEGGSVDGVLLLSKHLITVEDVETLLQVLNQ